MISKPIVYICHPIGGDVRGNLAKIRAIYEQIYREGNVIPFAPYLEGFNFLCDEQAEDRKLGIFNNKMFFQKKTFDVLWVFGTHISKGMKQEIDWCKLYGIEVFYIDTFKLELTLRQKDLLINAINFQTSYKIGGEDYLNEYKELYDKIFFL